MAATHRKLPVIDLGRMEYAAAYAVQQEHHAEVLALRETPEAGEAPGRILLVEHDPPVITVSQRKDARQHLLATPEMLAGQGVTVAETDRGGDITYHGPGQLVVYPIIDLNAHRLRLHDYMRLLEDAVIDALAEFGVRAERDVGATGVWVRPMSEVGSGKVEVQEDKAKPAAKICAMGVRVRRWVSLHGLALNVTTNLEHFKLIVPCGLAGRPVTSLRELLGARCPEMERVKQVLAAALSSRLAAARAEKAELAADERG
jgi:lipoate-protein ligase B